MCIITTSRPKRSSRTVLLACATVRTTRRFLCLYFCKLSEFGSWLKLKLELKFELKLSAG